VLDAAATLLFDEGMSALSYERIAAEAGVSKTTLYRWWTSIGELAAEAYFDRVENDLKFPDTGDIADDVRTQLRAFVMLLTTGGAGRVIAELIGAAQCDPTLQASFSNSYSRPRRALAVDAFRRAQQRGQLRDDVDPDLLVDQLWGACYHRLLIPDRPLDIKFADALVENAIRGAQLRIP
jgi:AcrR family transcriptional regulator